MGCVSRFEICSRPFLVLRSCVMMHGALDCVRINFMSRVLDCLRAFSRLLLIRWYVRIEVPTASREMPRYVHVGTLTRPAASR